MRDIKFRARHIKTGQWYCGSSLITDIYQGDEYSLTLSLFWLQVETGRLDTTTVGQYIGSKDKNSKEIYEGDIFSIPPDKHHNYEERNVVEYGDGTYLLEDHGLILNDWNDRGEIIGNVWENPELLQKGVRGEKSNGEENVL